MKQVRRRVISRSTKKLSRKKPKSVNKSRLRKLRSRKRTMHFG